MRTAQKKKSQVKGNHKHFPELVLDFLLPIWVWGIQTAPPKIDSQSNHSRLRSKISSASSSRSLAC